MKKILSVLMSAMVLLSGIAMTVSAVSFVDVDKENAALSDAVELLYSIGVTKGVSETEFGTEQNVTREQMAAFIYRMMNDGASSEGGENTTSFTDLEDPTFFPMISWAAENGIIKGRSESIFDPKGGITLQDAYTMIVRALGYDDGSVVYPYGYISYAEDNGLSENLTIHAEGGYTQTLTRGETAIVLANMYKAMTENKENA